MEPQAPPEIVIDLLNLLACGTAYPDFSPA